MLLSSCLGFSAIPFSVIISFFWFGESVTAATLTGAAVILCSGMMATVATKRTEAAEKAAMKYHRIKSGDTLGAIARRYGTTVNNICRMNNIKSTTVLRIGRSLRVR